MPHYLWAVGSGYIAIHSLTAKGPWTRQLLSCGATMTGGSGQWDCCNGLCHRLGGRRQWKSCNALPRSLGVVESATVVMHCLTAKAQC